MTWQTRLQNIKHLCHDLEQHSGRENLTFPNLTLFTDPVRTPDPMAMAEVLPSGCGLIYRHFGLGNRAEIALKLRSITKSRQISFLIGNDIELFEKVGADGVHFSESKLSEAKDFRYSQPKALVSMACHSLSALKLINASYIALDAVFISPIFASQSPSAQDKAHLGPTGARQFVEATSLPVYGLGGIHANTIPSLKGTGLCGVAGIDLLLN